MKWYKEFKESRWLAADIGSNMCRGLAYHKTIQLLAVMLEFEPEEDARRFDVVILLYDTDGLYLHGIKVKQENFVSQSPNLAPHGMVSHPYALSFFFVGQSAGYSTAYQFNADPIQDAYVYKIDF